VEILIFPNTSYSADGIYMPLNKMSTNQAIRTKRTLKINQLAWCKTAYSGNTGCFWRHLCVHSVSIDSRCR
ncbi:uncharacterized protein METZ01_LOCUS65649, partial [marine metagenome]